MTPAEEPAVLDELPLITPSPQPLSQTTAIIVSASAGLAFAALATWIARHGAAVPWVDGHLHRWAVEERTPTTITFATVATHGGLTRVVLPALVAVGAAAGAGAGAGRSPYRRVGSGLLLCLVASAGDYAEILVNAAIGRARPSVSDWAGAAAGPSFPSGHTTAATLFALCCAWAFTARVAPGWPRRAVWSLAACYAFAVGWSRVWLGVHWPTDVAAGWLFGVAWVTGSIAVTAAVRRRAARHQAARRLSPPSSASSPGTDPPPEPERRP